MKLKNICYLFISSVLLSGLSACSKEEMTFGEGEARITKIVEFAAARNKDDNPEKWPYAIDYTISATLSDVSNVEEWGIFFRDTLNNALEFPFKAVSPQETRNLRLNMIKDFLHVKDQNTSYLECKRYMGVYLKKKNRKGVLSTYYGEMNLYTLHFEFPSKPSVEFSNPKIVSLEEVEVDGVRKYRSKYSFDVTVKGSFWIDHLEDVLSSGWSWDKESNYFLDDGTSSRSYTSTYTPRNVQFSLWTVIHLCDSDQTIESKNWLNISGNPSISKIEVSDYERNI